MLVDVKQERKNGYSGAKNREKVGLKVGAWNQGKKVNGILDLVLYCLLVDVNTKLNPRYSKIVFCLCHYD